MLKAEDRGCKLTVRPRSSHCKYLTRYNAARTLTRETMNRIIAIVLLLSSVALSQTNTSKTAINQKPTAADAEKFVADAEKQLFDLGIRAQRAGWVQENFITDDTEQMSADVNDQSSLGATTELAKKPRVTTDCTLLLRHARAR